MKSCTEVFFFPDANHVYLKDSTEESGGATSTNADCAKVGAEKTPGHSDSDVKMTSPEKVDRKLCGTTSVLERTEEDTVVDVGEDVVKEPRKFVADVVCNAGWQ